MQQEIRKAVCSQMAIQVQMMMKPQTTVMVKVLQKRNSIQFESKPISSIAMEERMFISRTLQLINFVDQVNKTLQCATPGCKDKKELFGSKVSDFSLDHCVISFTSVFRVRIGRVALCFVLNMVNGTQMALFISTRQLS